MKNVFAIYLTALLVLSGCSDKETMYPKTMSFYAYGRDGSTLKTTQLTAQFYLFNANNGERFKEERVENPSGEASDYRLLECELLNLLGYNNELELEDGKKVKPVRIVFSFANESKFIDDIPDGKYYVLAIPFLESWKFKGKYSGKYFEKHKNSTGRELLISVIFPDDISFKGFFEWEEMKYWGDEGFGE